MTNFLSGQVAQMRSGGGATVLRKARLALMSMLALVPVFIVRGLRPLVVIRFGRMPSLRIGALAPAPEVYLCERDAGMHGNRALDLFYYPDRVCNLQLKKMWDRTLHVWDFAGPMHRVNKWIPGGAAHEVPWSKYIDRDVKDVMAGSTPHVSFSREEDNLGKVALEKMGIPAGAPYICFHARDDAYLKSEMPEADWSYHDLRNTDIHDYLPAVESMAEMGLYAVRMGAVVKDALDTSNPKIIDYAVHHRTDFLDIYLSANCYFFLSSATGLGTGVPMLFRRPTAFVNWLALGYLNSWGPDDLLIPQKLWNERELRFLSFPEILQSEIGLYERKEQYEAVGLTAINNSPQEISALTVEMLKRRNGTWESAPEDAELQERFWSLCRHSEVHGVIRSLVGAEFLRENRNLLERS